MKRSHCEMSVGHFSEGWALIFHLLVLATFESCGFSLSLAQDLKIVNYVRSQDLRMKPVAASHKGQNTVPPQKSAWGGTLTPAVPSSESSAFYGHCLLILARSTGSTTSISCCSCTQRPDCQEPEQTALVFPAACYRRDLPLLTSVTSCEAWKWAVRLGVTHHLANRTAAMLTGYH